MTQASVSLTSHTGERQASATPEQAMPLRIALLCLPCAELTSSESAILLPELHGSGLLDALPLIDITIEDFATDLQRTKAAIEAGSLVQLTADIDDDRLSILMIPALKAAQHRIHPHAVLTAMHLQSAPLTEVFNHALAQAKRSPEDVCQVNTFDGLNSQQQFAAVYELVHQLASRTWQRQVIEPTATSTAFSHYWFTEHHQARVIAANFCNNSVQNQHCSSYVLTQGTGLLPPKSILDDNRLQFILWGDDQAQLQQALDQLAQQLALAESESQLKGSNTAALTVRRQLLNLMLSNITDYQATGCHRRFVAVLQANSIDNLKTEINAMANALPQTIGNQDQYKTPAGSYFTAQALGSPDQAGLAFVYPGVGTVYSDMLSELHRYFPALYARLEREGNLKAMLQADAIYHTDSKTAAAMPLGNLAIAGVGASYLLTQLLVDEFQITPNFALGYSMGEASMWASLGVWENPHALIEKTQTDPLFTSAISGKLSAVRQAWQLSDDEHIDWNSFVVRCEAKIIEASLAQYPHVYLAIIQGDTCVIAGCEQQCRALLDHIGKRGIAANRVTAMHTTPAMQQHANVVDFYRQPLQDDLPAQIRFISAAADHKPVANAQGQLDSQVIATTIADTFCRTLDFTSLIHNAQAQGASLFVEIGADRQNCTLIDKIAKQDRQITMTSERPTTATLSAPLPCHTVPINAKGSSDVVSLLKAIGQLLSHKVPMSMQVLIKGLTQELARCDISQRQAMVIANKMNTQVLSRASTVAHTTLLKGEV